MVLAYQPGGPGSNPARIIYFCHAFIHFFLCYELCSSERKRKTDKRDDRVLFRSVKKNRRQTLTDLTVAFNDTLENNRVFSRTVRRRLTEEGYHRCKVTKTITILRKNRNERLTWCRTKLKWTVNENWCKVFFSDETKIVLGKDRKLYVWRKPHEKYRPECLSIF